MNHNNFKTNVSKSFLFCILILIFSSSTWTSTVSTNNPPTAGTIDPSSGSALPYQGKTFTTTFTDQDGYQDLDYCMLMINTEINPLNCFYARYTLDENAFSLMNDDGSTFLVHEKNLIQNSYALLDLNQSAVSYPDENTIQIEWFISFKKAFSGKTYNTYLYAKDKSGSRTGWKQKGTWTVKQY